MSEPLSHPLHAQPIEIASPEATFAHGTAWGERLMAGTVLAFHGPLGAGKTALTQGIAHGLGYRGEVTSPTFSLVHEYRGGRLPIYHLDLYRITDPAEALRFGVEEYLSDPDAVAIVEWPERIASLLPPATEHWEIEFVGEQQRRLFLRPTP